VAAEQYADSVGRGVLPDSHPKAGTLGLLSTMVLTSPSQLHLEINAATYDNSFFKELEQVRQRAASSMRDSSCAASCPTPRCLSLSLSFSLFLSLFHSQLIWSEVYCYRKIQETFLQLIEKYQTLAPEITGDLKRNTSKTAARKLHLLIDTLSSWPGFGGGGDGGGGGSDIEVLPDAAHPADDIGASDVGEEGGEDGASSGDAGGETEELRGFTEMDEDEAGIDFSGLGGASDIDLSKVFDDSLKAMCAGNDYEFIRRRVDKRMQVKMGLDKVV